jgi:hypothetical protein
VGNFLNAENRRLGGATGFKLETLSKLNDTKTSDNKKSMFEVIVEMVYDTKPDLLKFSKADVELLSNGARISLTTLEPELRKLQKQFEGNMRSLLKASVPCAVVNSSRPFLSSLLLDFSCFSRI